jgi:DNA-binding FadR family transcriptional regulator
VDILAALAEVSFERGRIPIKLVKELLEIRRMLAVEVVGLVAERADALVLQELRADLSALAQVHDSSGEFMMQDLAFARRFVRAADNLSLELLLNSVVRVVQSNAKLSLLFDANSAGAVEAYGRLLDLIPECTGEQARSQARHILTELDAATIGELSRWGQ